MENKKLKIRFQTILSRMEEGVLIINCDRNKDHIEFHNKAFSSIIFGDPTRVVSSLSHSLDKVLVLNDFSSTRTQKSIYDLISMMQNGESLG